MEKIDWKENRYGLIGKDIGYSFSRGYFSEKFEKLDLQNHSYENFDLSHISEFPKLLDLVNLRGLNITIPYKEEIIPFLDNLDEEARNIGAVNTIKFKGGQLIGFNTDVYGFKNSIEPHLGPQHSKALILGTGGASKAIFYVLEQMKIKASFVSRKTIDKGYSYEQLTPEIIKEHCLIVNCTPLGTHPNILTKPKIPYKNLGAEHLLYDLNYNPAKSAFLIEGEKRGCSIKNGLKMLELQAEKSWEIWNS